MRKTYSILFTVLLISNSLLVLSLHISTLAKGLDYGMDQNLGDVNASFWGESFEDYSGYSVARAGDVNGDGFDDILIGAWGDDNNNHSYAGQTYLILGKSSGWAMDTDLAASKASFWGEHTFDFSGQSVAGAGDVNGDGYDDILICATGNDEGAANSGQTYLILGKASGWAMDTNLSDSDASFWGENQDDLSGGSVASAGDVNGDGYDDILIGADGKDDGGNDAGQTYLILGKASGWAMDTDLSTSDASFWGEDAGDGSGISVAGAGDVNGDGYDDILIGAFRSNIGSPDSGRTYLILGKASGWTMDTDLSASNVSFSGEGTTDYSGFSVAGVGDVNGDGFDDILIGAPNNDDGGGQAGQTYLIFGKASGWTGNRGLSASNASFWGEEGGDESGYSVAGAGDVNGDGFDDILIGAYDHLGGTGKTYLILGKASGWAMDTDLSTSDSSFMGEAVNDMSGYSITSAADVNGDGYDDILIGAQMNNAAAADAGQTYLIFPDHNSPPSAIASIKAFSNPEFIHEIFSASVNDTIYIELHGQDSDSNRVNLAEVNVTGNANPLLDFRLRLYETGANTGIFRGNITIANRTHRNYQWINATMGGWVNVCSRQDPSKFVNISMWDEIKIEPRPVDVYVNEDADFSMNFTTEGADPDMWDFNTNATCLSWNPDTLNVSGTPNNTEVGKYWIFLKVQRGGLTDFINFTLIVNNTQPEIITPDVTTAYQDRKYLVDYNSSDDGQGTIAWHLNTNSQWLNLNENSGILNGTPRQSDVGNHTVNISVDDGNGGWDYSEFLLWVIDVNDPPVLENISITPDTINRGDHSTIYIEAKDPESGTEIMNPLVEAKSSMSDWIMVNCSYNIGGDNFTADYVPSSISELGKHSFRTKLTDNENVSSEWYYFNDSLTVRNAPPVILEIFENISVYNDLNLLLDLVSYATDYEDFSSELLWEIVEYSPITLFDAYMKNDTVVVIWPASEEKSGLGKIHFSVKDSNGGISHANITVEILNTSEISNVVITLESPENSTIINTETINLTWSTEGDIGSITFDVYYGDSIDNMSLEFLDVQEESVELTGLMDNTTYYWQIIAKIDEVPTVFESGKRHFTVQLPFVSVHNIQLTFSVENEKIPIGDSIIIIITLENTGNVDEDVFLEVLDDLKGYVSMDTEIHLEKGAKRTIELKVFADSKLAVKTYYLTIQATYSSVESSASMSIDVVKKEESESGDKKLESWTWIIVAVVLFLAIVAILTIVIKKKKKKEDSKGEAKEADIEMQPKIGITGMELDKLAIGGIELSHDSGRNASVFRIDEPMSCSICYGEISSGLQAFRCSCGNISHLSCGIKVCKCSECADDYQGMLNTVSQEAIVQSIEDSQRTARREVEV